MKASIYNENIFMPISKFCKNIKNNEQLIMTPTIKKRSIDR